MLIDMTDNKVAHYQYHCPPEMLFHRHSETHNFAKYLQLSNVSKEQEKMIIYWSQTQLYYKIPEQVEHP